VDVREYLREELFEEGAHGYMTEAELERRLALFEGRAASAAGGVRAQARTGEEGTTVPESDPAITIERRIVEAEPDDVEAYIARPTGASKAPGILVIHENRGLTPHIRDVARRLAKLGFVALAPDLLTPKGGADSFDDPAAAIAALGELDRGAMVDELLACLEELSALPEVDPSRVGVTGFCFGGGMAWRVATKAPQLRAAVPFYGSIPPLEDVPGIGAAVLAIYGGLDERINAGIADIEGAMAANGKSFEKEIYEGAEHAFHNDTNPDRYHPEAAAAAWARTAAFFAEHLA